MSGVHGLIIHYTREFSPHGLFFFFCVVIDLSVFFFQRLCVQAGLNQLAILEDNSGTSGLGCFGLCFMWCETLSSFKSWFGCLWTVNRYHFLGFPIDHPVELLVKFGPLWNEDYEEVPGTVQWIKWVVVSVSIPYVKCSLPKKVRERGFRCKTNNAECRLDWCRDHHSEQVFLRFHERIVEYAVTRWP
jgi:hypothetical protein